MSAKQRLQSGSTQFPVLGLRDMSLVRATLSVIGAWPAAAFNLHQQLVYRVLHYGLPVLTVSIFICLLDFTYRNIKTSDLFVKAQCALIISVDAMVLYRNIQVMTRVYGEQIRTFVEKYHLHHYKDYDDECQKIFKKVYKYSLLYAYIEAVLSVVLPFSTASMTWVINYQNGFYSRNRPENVTAERITFWSVPFLDYEPNAFLIHVSDFLAALVGSQFALFFDMLIVLMVAHLIGHIYMMLHKVRALSEPPPPDPAHQQQPQSILYTQKQQQHFARKLKDIVQHHNDINAFCSLISDFSGGIVTINYCYQLMSGCLLLILTTTMEPGKAARFLCLTVITFLELISVSIVFELVVIASDKLGDAVYMSPWELVDPSQRRSMLLLLMFAQRRLQVKGFGIVLFGMQTMISIFKTTMSYYIFLKGMT